MYGFPHIIGGWCKRLKYGGQIDLRRYILQTLQAAQESDARENLRGGYKDFKIFGFPMQRMPWCSSHIKTDALRLPVRIIRGRVVSSAQNGSTTALRQDKLRGATGCSKGISSTERSGFSDERGTGAKINVVQYLGIAADEPERIERHKKKPGIVLPLVDIGWDEAYCRKWCEENDLLSPIYTTATRGGCWFCHNQGVNQLRLLRKNYPDLWALLLKWDNDSPTSFHADGHTVHDFERRFALEDEGAIKADEPFYWYMLSAPTQINIFDTIGESE